jgi:hypothetical protein
MGRRTAAAIAALALAAVWAPGAQAASGVGGAAPYEYLGWGDPQPPAQVIESTGVRGVTLAFILSHGTCNPEWDGSRPLLGGRDQQAIDEVRAAGGDVVASFGGWSGRKLGNSCTTPAALAAAYQKVIGAYALKAIDVDIEHGEMASAKVRQRVVEALAIVQRSDPGLEISITFATGEAGPEATGVSLIADAARIGFRPTSWTVMPFDFGRPSTDMGHASILGVEGLVRDLVKAYGTTAAAAYRMAGISSMNGHTDEASETVTVADFETMIAFAELHEMARFTFWSLNRDRPCAADPECSGIEQAPFAFTRLVAGFAG